MLQYIIYSSLIWLVSLVMYEWLFKKESFHQFNRMYLLFSLSAGLIIPLINFSNLVSDSQQTILKPVTQVYKMKESLVVNPTHALRISTSSSVFNVEQFLWIIYIIGILIGSVLLMKEIIYLIKLFHNGHKTNEQDCIIVQTGKSHAAFSIFNILFINHKDDYTKAQWEFLIAHEKEHHQQLHIIDNLLLIILRILAWFNPLTHIYFNKLRIVHEFQADEAAASDKAEYGLFLIEQGLLQGAPILAHSFNYSPIKNRIAMLVKSKSKRNQLFKYMSIVPLFLIFIVCCTQSSYSGDISKKESSVIFKGNKVEFEEYKIVPYAYMETYLQQKKMFMNVALEDSVLVKNLTTGLAEMQKVETERLPSKLNGNQILGNENSVVQHNNFESDYTIPIFIGGEKDITSMLYSSTKNELNSLDDGEYYFRVNNMVVDVKGSIAYYEDLGIESYTPPGEEAPSNSTELLKSIENNMALVLNKSGLFKPAVKADKPVNVRYYLSNYILKVKNHKAQLLAGGGC